MKWDQKNKVFRPGDYQVNIKWFERVDVIDTLILFSLQLKSINPLLEIVKHESEPFIWNRSNLQETISERIDLWLERREEDTDPISPVFIFRTGIEGIDLMVFAEVLDERKPLLETIVLDFNEKHLDTADGIFSYQILYNLFYGLAINLKPDYAVIERAPACTDPWSDWYGEIMVSIDTTKIPVQLEWFNFFYWEWVNRIGERRFENVPEGKTEYTPGGIIYIMQEEPFSYENPEHIKRLRRLQKHFGLNKLHKKYRR